MKYGPTQDITGEESRIDPPQMITTTMDPTPGFSGRRAANPSMGYLPPPHIPSNQDTTPRVSSNDLSPMGASSSMNSAPTPQSSTQPASMPSASYSYQSGGWPTPTSSASSAYVYSNPNQDQNTPLTQPSYSNATPATTSTTRALYSDQSISSYARQAPPPQPPTPTTTTDTYRSSPSHNYYAATSAGHQPSFPSFASPVSQPHQHHQHHQQHPIAISSAMGGRGLVSMSSHNAHGMSQSYAPRSQYQQHYPPISAVGSNVLSNISAPNSAATLVGGVSGSIVHPPHMYGMYHQHHPGQMVPPTDRPFKCDQCPQSFNRNHDLKRHKRIHLAVKPYPCTHCDKSFSRKDALKRHRLVKGCGSESATADPTVTTGTTPTNATTTTNSTMTSAVTIGRETSNSPAVKSDSVLDHGQLPLPSSMYPS